MNRAPNVGAALRYRTSAAGMSWVVGLKTLDHGEVKSLRLHWLVFGSRGLLESGGQPDVLRSLYVK